MIKVNAEQTTDKVLNDLAASVHQIHKHFWFDAKTGEPLVNPVPDKINLIFTELGEAIEARRKNLKDSHLPHRDGFEVEIADTLVRIFDLCGYMGLDIGGAFCEKIGYNLTRADHKPEARAAEGGKKY